MAKDKTKQPKSIDDHLDYAEKTYKYVNSIKPKRLLDPETGQLKAREFEANGKEYVILKREDSFNVARTGAHMILEMMFANAKSLKDLYEANAKTVEMIDGIFLGKHRFTQLAEHAEQIRKGYFQDNIKREHIAFYQCSLFIVRVGDNLTDWNWQTADEYIQDWAKANIYAPDLFRLALVSYPDYIEIWKNHTAIGSDGEGENKNESKSQK